VKTQARHPEPLQPAAAGGSPSTAATPPPMPSHRPSWLSLYRTRWLSLT